MLNVKKTLTKILQKTTMENIVFTYSSNSYVGSTDFGRINGKKFGNVAIINFNLYLTNAIPASGSAKIGTMSVSATNGHYVALPAQSSANHLSISITGNEISVSNGYSTSLSAGWYRVTVAIAIN